MPDSIRSFLQGHAKQSSNDSYNFPEPCVYKTEKVGECGPFKVYLGIPEVTAEGNFLWADVQCGDSIIDIECASVGQCKKFLREENFIARVIRPDSNIISRRLFERIS